MKLREVYMYIAILFAKCYIHVCNSKGVSSHCKRWEGLYATNADIEILNVTNDRIHWVHVAYVRNVFIFARDMAHHSAFF